MRRACLVVFSLVTACGDDDPSGAAYELRIGAAEERVVEAICACLWTDELRNQCLADAEKYLNSACLPEAGDAFSRRYKAYAACLADTAEQQARCIEEADCNFRDFPCVRDTLAECGPVPKDLSAELAACLPPFICATGQKVALTNRCDGVPDCFDRSDEASCEDEGTNTP